MGQLSNNLAGEPWVRNTLTKALQIPPSAHAVLQNGVRRRRYLYGPHGWYDGYIQANLANDVNVPTIVHMLDTAPTYNI